MNCAIAIASCPVAQLGQQPKVRVAPCCALRAAQSGRKSYKNTGLKRRNDYFPKPLISNESSDRKYFVPDESEFPEDYSDEDYLSEEDESSDDNNISEIVNTALKSRRSQKPVIIPTKKKYRDISDESDYAEEEGKEDHTSDIEAKLTVKNFLQKLRARRLDRKLAERVYDSASEEDEVQNTVQRKNDLATRKKSSIAVAKHEVQSNMIRRNGLSTQKKTLYAEEDKVQNSIRKRNGFPIRKITSESDDDEPTEVSDQKDRGFSKTKEEFTLRLAKTKQEVKLSKEEVKLRDAFYSNKSFKKLGASEEIIDALSSLDVTRPSEIQALSYKEVLKGNSCIIADQTGSGKTLAYLAPLIQRLRQQEENGDFSTPNNPRVLILVPTSELAMQVLSVCRAMSKRCPFKSMVATGGFKWKTQVENLQNGPDIVVATPGRFLHHLESQNIQLNKLQSVVLDEVDILFEEEEFVEAMQKVRSMSSTDVQYIHVTATLPTDVHDKILNKHPHSVPLLGPSLHLTAPGLNEILVDCSGGDEDEKTPESAFDNKKAELLILLEDTSVKKTIIFCNKILTCRKVENIVKRYDRSGKKLSVLPYHAALSQEARLQSMQQFLDMQPENPTFLVCTDRASRGLDSIGVERVILFDFPRDPSEYIRRVGRTARAGGAGKVYVFVVGKQVGLARKVMERNEKRHPVHAVPGSL